jgi:hypothetical protein
MAGYSAYGGGNALKSFSNESRRDGMRITTRAVALGLFAILNVYTWAGQEGRLTEMQMREFLLNTKIVRSRGTSKGITGVARLTLTDGKITNDASFQAIDEARPMKEFASGQRELNFRDSYKFNIAAYELARILGLGDMMPVTVERKYQGKTGSLSWWLPVKMDEGDRIKKKITPPDPEAWNRQIHKMRVFTQLVYDTDRNLGNVLISENWNLVMIDFTRAFRTYTELENAKNLQKCDRQLLENLRTLDAALVTEKTKGYLNGAEIKGVMVRRDKIVALFEKLIKERGESQVLY